MGVLRNLRYFPGSDKFCIMRLSLFNLDHESALLPWFRKSRISLEQAVHVTQFELMIANYYIITDQLIVE